MEETFLKTFMNLGVFGIFGFAFFWFLKYYLVQNEKREEGYKEEIKRGAEREVSYQTIVRENQEIMKKQANSISDIKEIKTILKIKSDQQQEGIEH